MRLYAAVMHMFRQSKKLNWRNLVSQMCVFQSKNDLKVFPWKWQNLQKNNIRLLTNQCGFIDQKPLSISTSSTLILSSISNCVLALALMFPLRKQRKKCTKEDKSYPCPSLSSCHQIWSQHGLHPHRSWRNHWGMSLTSDLQTRTDSGFSMIVRKKKQKKAEIER